MDRYMQALVDGLYAAQARERAARPDFWAELALVQRPGVLAICCSDSRAAPEIIADADPGQLFVARSVAGLVPTPPGRIERAWLGFYGATTRALGLRDLSGAWYGPWASIEFPVVRLEVPNILALAHSGCGGVALARRPRGALPELADVDSWVDMVRPTVRRMSEGRVDEAEAQRAAENAAVLWTTRNLLRHPAIAARQRAGSLAVYAGHYDIATGAFELWDDVEGRFRDPRLGSPPPPIAPRRGVR